jgi:hypothetical protein
MFVQHVGLSPLPIHARIEQPTLTQVLRRLASDQTALRAGLRGGFGSMERRHPDLAMHLAEQVSDLEHDKAQGLAFFLAVLVYDSFQEAFGRRLGAVTEMDLERARTQLLLDGEVRGSGAAGDSYSEDLLTLGQPALVRLIRGELDRALDEAQLPQDSTYADQLFETLLLEILVLSQAVEQSPIDMAG